MSFYLELRTALIINFVSYIADVVPRDHLYYSISSTKYGSILVTAEFNVGD